MKRGIILFKKELLVLTTNQGTTQALGYNPAKKSVLVHGQNGSKYELPWWAISLASQSALAATAGLPSL